MERKDQHHHGRETGKTRCILGLAPVFFLWSSVQQAQASYGAVSCFVVIGSQQQVPSAGLLTVNTIYTYTPMRLLSGTNRVIPGID